MEPQAEAAVTMPAEKIREDEEDIPRRRSSSRLQAKAEKNVTDKAEDITPSRSTRQRSRSRSTGRKTKTETKIEDDKLIIIEEETTGIRSRTTTPKRTTRGKSPSREPTTPVRLTRSARKLGYRTPDAEKKDSPKLAFADSPASDCIPEGEVRVSPQTLPKDSDTSPPEIIQISDEDEEPMDVSEAEFLEISTIPKDVGDIRDGQKEIVVTEKIELKVERTLETKYIFGEAETTVADEPKNDEEERIETHETKHIEQVEEEPSKTIEDTEKTSPETISGYLSEDDQNKISTGNVCISGDSLPLQESGDKESSCLQEIIPMLDDGTETQITVADTVLVAEEVVHSSEAEVTVAEKSIVCQEKRRQIKKKRCLTEEKDGRLETVPKKNHSESADGNVGDVNGTKDTKWEGRVDELPSSENPQPGIKKGKKKTKVSCKPADDSTKDYCEKQTGKPSRAIKEKKATKKSQKMVDNDEHVDRDVCTIAYPDLTLKKMFTEPSNCCTQLTTLLQELYAWNNKNQRRVDDLPDTFLNNDSETIWQFIAHKNRQIDKDWRKHKSVLDEPIAVSGFSSEVEDNEEDEEAEEISALDESSDKENDSELDDIADEEERDLFNLNDEDLKDLERELEDERGLQNELPLEADVEKPAKKFRKSIVDDKFFNLAEMNAFCDEAEKQNEQENILLTADDSWGGPANYRYEDFFGTLDDVVNDENDSVQVTRKRKADEANKTEVKKKSVRFALENEDDTEKAEDSQKLPKTAKTLFGVTHAEEAESRLKADIRKLKESIRKFEEENLQPRSWELSGEVTAQQRAENELLETHLQFDNTAKRAPEITEEFTERIEALIKQRIKDQAFDDVVRIKKVDEKREVYRNEAIEEQETMKKSLAEVYEKDYQKAAGQAETSDKENSLHKELEDRMNNLFNLIDAMSHFEYTPPTVKPEIKVVSNMDALQMEEVGMQASTDAQLLAPEEIRKKQKGELKADEERTKTDKQRLRRKKKTKQRVMIGKIGAEKALAGQIEKKMKKKKVVDQKEDALKSSNFFSKLQDTVQKELKDKTTKKKKVKSEKVKTSGSKFKL